MRERLVLHVGLDKTGSSSLQHSLFRRRLEGVQYLHFGMPNSSFPLRLICEPDAEAEARRQARITQGAVSADAAERHLDVLLAQVTGHSAPVAILSAEAIPGFSPAALQRLKSLVAPHVRQLEVVAYIRPPVPYMHSRFQHGVRTARKREFGVGVGYRGRLAALDTVFGPASVSLRQMEPSALIAGDVVVDFVTRLGAVIDPEDVIRVNQSLPAEAIALLYLRNQRGAAQISPRRARRLATLLSGIGRGRLRLGPDALLPVLQRRKDDIAWTERRLGASFDLWMPPETAETVTLNSEADLLALAAAQVDAVEDMLLRFGGDGSAGVSPRGALQDMDHLAARVDLLGALADRAPDALDQPPGST